MISSYICRYFCGFTKDIAKQLLVTSKDALSAYDDISVTISCITAARADGEVRFRAIFHEAHIKSELSRKHLILPHRCDSQTYRSNDPANSPEELWRRSVYIPFADHLVCELKSLFNQLSTTAIRIVCFSVCISRSDWPSLVRDNEKIRDYEFSILAVRFVLLFIRHFLSVIELKK